MTMHKTDITTESTTNQRTTMSLLDTTGPTTSDLRMTKEATESDTTVTEGETELTDVTHDFKQSTVTFDITKLDNEFTSDFSRSTMNEVDQTTIESSVTTTGVNSGLTGDFSRSTEDEADPSTTKVSVITTVDDEDFTSHSFARTSVETVVVSEFTRFSTDTEQTFKTMELSTNQPTQDNVGSVTPTTVRGGGHSTIAVTDGIKPTMLQTIQNTEPTIVVSYYLSDVTTSVTHAASTPRTHQSTFVNEMTTTDETESQTEYSTGVTEFLETTVVVNRTTNILSSAGFISTTDAWRSANGYTATEYGSTETVTVDVSWPITDYTTTVYGTSVETAQTTRKDISTTEHLKDLTTPYTVHSSQGVTVLSSHFQETSTFQYDETTETQTETVSTAQPTSSSTFAQQTTDYNTAYSESTAETEKTSPHETFPTSETFVPLNQTLSVLTSPSSLVDTSETLTFTGEHETSTESATKTVPTTGVYETSSVELPTVTFNDDISVQETVATLPHSSIASSVVSLAATALSEPTASEDYGTSTIELARTTFNKETSIQETTATLPPSSITGSLVSLPITAVSEPTTSEFPTVDTSTLESAMTTFNTETSVQETTATLPPSSITGSLVSLPITAASEPTTSEFPTADTSNLESSVQETTATLPSSSIASSAVSFVITALSAAPTTEFQTEANTGQITSSPATDVVLSTSYQIATSDGTKSSRATTIQLTAAVTDEQTEQTLPTLYASTESTTSYASTTVDLFMSTTEKEIVPTTIDIFNLTAPGGSETTTAGFAPPSTSNAPTDITSTTVVATTVPGGVLPANPQSPSWDNVFYKINLSFVFDYAYPASESLRGEVTTVLRVVYSKQVHSDLGYSNIDENALLLSENIEGAGRQRRDIHLYTDSNRTRVNYTILYVASTVLTYNTTQSIIKYINETALDELKISTINGTDIDDDYIDTYVKQTELLSQSNNLMEQTENYCTYGQVSCDVYYYCNQTAINATVACQPICFYDQNTDSNCCGSSFQSSDLQCERSNEDCHIIYPAETSQDYTCTCRPNYVDFSNQCVDKTLVISSAVGIVLLIIILFIVGQVMWVCFRKNRRKWNLDKETGHRRRRSMETVAYSSDTFYDVYGGDRKSGPSTSYDLRTFQYDSPVYQLVETVGPSRSPSVLRRLDEAIGPGTSLPDDETSFTDETSSATASKSSQDARGAEYF